MWSALIPLRTHAAFVPRIRAQPRHSRRRFVLAEFLRSPHSIRSGRAPWPLSTPSGCGSADPATTGPGAGPCAGSHRHADGQQDPVSRCEVRRLVAGSPSATCRTRPATSAIRRAHRRDAISGNCVDVPEPRRLPASRPARESRQAPLVRKWHRLACSATAEQANVGGRQPIRTRTTTLARTRSRRSSRRRPLRPRSLEHRDRRSRCGRPIASSRTFTEMTSPVCGSTRRGQALGSRRTAV